MDKKKPTWKRGKSESSDTPCRVYEHSHAYYSDQNFGRVDIFSYGPTKMDIITEIGTIRFVDGKAWFDTKDTI
jgi:hypothetical protein